MATEGPRQWSRVDRWCVVNEALAIHSMEVTAEGLGVTYTRYPTDIRKNGLAWQHHVLVPFDSDYDDELEAVQIAMQALLKDVLDDEDRAEPIAPDEEEEPDDDDTDTDA